MMNCSARIFSRATSARTRSGTSRSASYRVSGPWPETLRVSAIAAEANRPTSSLVNPLSAAGGGHKSIRAQPPELLLAEPAQCRGGLVVREHTEVDTPRDHPVFDVMHRVSDVVGPVHHLRLQAGSARRCAVADPCQYIGVLRVGAELAVVRTALPRVLGDCVECSASQVETRTDALSVKGFRLKPGEDP